MSEEKKILIDDDWKSQVAAEKEELKREAEELPTEPTQPQPQPQEMPPASFEMLMTMFATEAMAALGQLPNPMTNELSTNIEHARYAIDMLQMLEGGILSPTKRRPLKTCSTSYGCSL